MGLLTNALSKGLMRRGLGLIKHGTQILLKENIFIGWHLQSFYIK